MSDPIIFVPIEPIEERYSVQWFAWFMDSFKRLNKPCYAVGDGKTQEIKVGEFLDVFNTCSYKAQQMAEIIDHIKNGFRGTIFFMDLWFPGIEHLAYIRDNAKIDIKIKGIFHAGTWDLWDFITQNGCREWASNTETGWLYIADEVYVATQFHKDMILESRGSQFEHKIEVVKFPVFKYDDLAFETKKEDLVIFPHRHAPEKYPALFERIVTIYRQKYPDSGVQFIRTKDIPGLTKAHYYNWLARAKVAVSTALQETFGIAMLEAVNLGCYPVCPDSLSYPETMKGWPRYSGLDDIEGAVHLIHEHLAEYSGPKPSGYDMNADDIVRRI